MQDLVKVEKNKRVVDIVLQRSERLNALSFELVEQLSNCIQDLENDKQILIIKISGDGGKSFCAGADLKERSAFDEQKTERFLDLLNDTLSQIEDSKHIYIAVIDGFAFGGGFELALACDYRFATSSSSLGLPEVSIGVMPGAFGIARSIKVCGFANAFMIALSGEKFGAKKAKELQMVNEVFEDQKLLKKYLDQFINKLLDKAPLSISAVKKALNYSFQKSRVDVMRFERDLYKELLKTKDKEEGLNAFLQKRKPEFLGL